MSYNPDRALELLRIGTGNPQAQFRPDQEKAIHHIVEGMGRLLVVQKTGWGKSFVYFIACKLLREQGFGPALLVSPLLSLMRNQIAAAERMGVCAVEQLDKYKFGPVYVRTKGEESVALTALIKKGALPWPEPDSVVGFLDALHVECAPIKQEPQQGELF